jgi:hypothetical protein
MKIVEGLIAVVIPHIVSICPHEDGWCVIIYGNPPTDDNPSGIVEKHFVKTIDAGKSWASSRIAELQGMELSADDAGPKLPWESLVCNPRGRAGL